VTVRQVENFERVTRFEVIDHRYTGDAERPVKGRIVVAYGVIVTVDLQDGGRTLKVFLNDRELPATRRNSDGDRTPGYSD
jgi:hypothetical protein